MSIGKPHIYFNIVRRQWVVKRNQASPDAWIRALSFTYNMNLKGAQL